MSPRSDLPKPIPPREMVQCMDQHIEWALSRTKDGHIAVAEVTVAELAEWRDVVAKVAREVE